MREAGNIHKQSMRKQGIYVSERRREYSQRKHEKQGIFMREAGSIMGSRAYL